MTVTANSVNITDEELSEFRMLVMLILRDKADLNILLDDVQFTDQEYRGAIRLAVSGYNTMTPATAVDFKGIPEYILFHWVAYFLMLSESFLQVRNQVSIPTDNIGVIGLDDKAGLYNNIAQGLKNEAKTVAQKFKSQQNLEGAYGGLPSGYSSVSRFQQN